MEGRVWPVQPLAVIWALEETNPSGKGWFFFILRGGWEKSRSAMDRKSYLKKEGWDESPASGGAPGGPGGASNSKESGKTKSITELGKRSELSL